MTDDFEVVACAVCAQRMSMINNRHLKLHGLTTAAYKERFPAAPTLSPAAQQRASERNTKNNAGRKGVPRSAEVIAKMSASLSKVPRGPRGPMSQEQKDLLSKLGKARTSSPEFVHPNQGKHHSEELKQKIAQTLTGRTIGPEAAMKALKTKEANGHDLAFFRGHQHSEETRALIGEKSRALQQANRAEIRAHMFEKLELAHVTLLNQIDDEFFRLQCRACDHIFTRTPQMFQPSKFHPFVCPQCNPLPSVSVQEGEVAAFIASLLPNEKMWRSDRTLIGPLELDIVLPNLQLAIEYCGLYRHSIQAGRAEWYHKFKLEKCIKLGVRLVTIFEDEWKHKRVIVESLLRNACHLSSRRLDARKCSVREVPARVAIDFLNENHLQGAGKSKIKYGLFFKDELVSVMTFRDEDITMRSRDWQIGRFATKLDTLVRGGAGRLFQAFIRDHHPPKVISYADLRWGSGAVYGQLGFVRSDDTKPNYWYIDGDRRIHRFNLRKPPGADPTISEFDLRSAEGWYWLYDCGHARWLWNAADLLGHEHVC
jgi:rubrerythrin